MSQYFRALLVPRGLPGSGKFAGQWDADHVTVSAGNTTVLLDQSGHGNNLPAIVAAPAPVTVGGKLVLQPTGTQHYDLDPLSVIPTQDDIALITVCKPNATGLDQIVHGISGSNAGISIKVDSGNSGGHPGAYLRDFEHDEVDIAATAAARHVYIAQRSGTLTRFYKDGAPLVPGFGTVIHAGYTRASVFGPDHFFAGDWRSSLISSSFTKKELEDLVASIAASEGITLLNPAASYPADDDFSVGATIDTAGTRRAGATAWTALDLGAVTNAQAGGTLSLTLAQEANVNFRGYSQPVVTSGGTLVQVYRAKLIPANLGTVDTHRAALILLDTVSNRAFTVEVGYNSAQGNRRVRVGAYTGTNTGSWTDVNPDTSYFSGFSAADWNQEWSLYAMWDDNWATFWYQIGAGKPQYLVSTNFAFFGGGGGTRPQLIAIGVSSRNAAGGNTVADFTDFAREF